jgi:hypothetical protein
MPKNSQQVSELHRPEDNLALSVLSKSVEIHPERSRSAHCTTFITIVIPTKRQDWCHDPAAHGGTRCSSNLT